MCGSEREAVSNQTGRLPSTDRLELDAGLAASPPETSVHKAVHVEVSTASEHVVAGAAEASGEDAQGLAFAVLGAEAGDVLLALDQTSIGHESLDALEAGDVVELVEERDPRRRMNLRM